MRNQIFNYSISASSISSSQIAPEKIQAALEKTGLQHILVECLLDGRPRVKVEPPLIIYEKPGVYTREVRELYNMQIQAGKAVQEE